MKEQTRKIFQHMKKNGSITALEAIQAYGVTRLSARIWELRHDYGYTIRTKLVRVKTRAGEATVAKYILDTRSADRRNGE